MLLKKISDEFAASSRDGVLLCIVIFLNYYIVINLGWVAVTLMATSLLISFGFDVYNQISKCCGYTNICELNKKFQETKTKLEKDRLDINLIWIEGRL